MLQCKFWIEDMLNVKLTNRLWWERSYISLTWTTSSPLKRYLPQCCCFFLHFVTHTFHIKTQNFISDRDKNLSWNSYETRSHQVEKDLSDSLNHEVDVRKLPASQKYTNCLKQSKLKTFISTWLNAVLADVSSICLHKRLTLGLVLCQSV